jgi:hypothetical protein
MSGILTSILPKDTIKQLTRQPIVANPIDDSAGIMINTADVPAVPEITVRAKDTRAEKLNRLSKYVK